MAFDEGTWVARGVPLDVVGWVAGSGDIAPELDGSRASGFVPVTAGVAYQFALYVPAGRRAWTRVCCYDARQALIGEVWYVNISTIYHEDMLYHRSSEWVAPTDAAYVRLSTLFVDEGGYVDMLAPCSGGGWSLL